MRRSRLDAAPLAAVSRTPVRFSVNQITTMQWPFERDVDAFAAAGVGAVGIAIRKLEAYGVARAVRLVRAAGLAVSCLTSSGPAPLGDAAGERAALERTRRHLDAAAELGADCLMTLPGSAIGWSWEENAARARPLLEALLPHAEQAGVRIALEPTSQLRMDLAFLHSFDEALDFTDVIDSPWLTVVLELNNAWIEPRLYDNIRRRTPRIGIVQVSDFRVGTLAANERVVIGDGDIPLRRICRALAAAGYAGWYDIELLGSAIEAEGYEAVLPRAIARFRALWDEGRNVTSDR
jgi:sugar phosphate isomerase/epimerase